jgi:hypothetical protein
LSHGIEVGFSLHWPAGCRFRWLYGLRHRRGMYWREIDFCFGRVTWDLLLFSVELVLIAGDGRDELSCKLVGTFYFNGITCR